MEENPDKLLENAEEIEVTEEGKIVPRGSSERKRGKGVQLPPHTFYN
jgi:hypothetical protein